MINDVMCTFQNKPLPAYQIRVRKTAKIRNQYNQVPHLTLKKTKSQKDITNNSQEVRPFLAGDHKAAMNRRESMTNTSK